MGLAWKTKSGCALRLHHTYCRKEHTVFDHIAIDWRDIMDIAVVSILLYQVIQMLRGSRALTVLTGLGLLTLLYFFSNALNSIPSWPLAPVTKIFFIIPSVILKSMTDSSTE